MILNINTKLLIFYVIIMGTITKWSNGNEETCVTATRRGATKWSNGNEETGVTATRRGA